MKNHLLKLVSFIVIVLTIYLSPFKIIVVQGYSMYPTLKDKQLLLGIKTNKFEKDDIVVANVEDNCIIKRIKYIGGDEVYYLLNNESELPILISKSFYEHYKKNGKFETVQKFIVESDKFFLLGDNSDVSDDSRRFGCLTRDAIKYKIVFPRL